MWSGPDLGLTVMRSQVIILDNMENGKMGIEGKREEANLVENASFKSEPWKRGFVPLEMILMTTTWKALMLRLFQFNHNSVINFGWQPLQADIRGLL